MKTKLFITGLALMALTTLSYAQEKTSAQSQQTATPVTRGAYVDADNNGVCDNFETNRAFNGKGRRMGNSSAVSGGQGFRKGQCCGLGPCRGKGPDVGQGRGPAPKPGRNYVDENNNGICDYRETSVKK
jgi:hypothetical protein